MTNPCAFNCVSEIAATWVLKSVECVREPLGPPKTPLSAQVQLGPDFVGNILEH